VKWCVVVNPRAGAGRAGQRLEEIRRAAGEELEAEVRLTEGPSHATELARRAVDEGFDGVVAVGGDGTANEVVNGLIDGDRPRRDGVVFALLHAGTGGDLRRSLQVPEDPRQALRAFRDRPARPMDLLHLRFRGHDGEMVERIGVNVTGIGLGGEVVARANRGSKRLGPLTFAVATVAALREYRPPVVRFEARTEGDRSWEWSGPLSSAFLANGAYCGGGMWVGKGGALDDGWADFTVVPPMSVPRMMLGGPRLFTGSIDRVKGVSRIPTQQLRAFPVTEIQVLIDVDGEQPGLLPLEARVLQKILRAAY
jgi:diacylglycerol kinase family enzyme